MCIALFRARERTPRTPASAATMFRCDVCGCEGAATDADFWTARTRTKFSGFTAEFNHDRSLRCKKCGDKAARDNNAWLEEQRPMAQQPDKCMDCRVTLDEHNCSKSQRKGKSRGDRRCKKCSAAHAADVAKEEEHNLGKKRRG